MGRHPNNLLGTSSGPVCGRHQSPDQEVGENRWLPGREGIEPTLTPTMGDHADVHMSGPDFPTSPLLGCLSSAVIIISLTL